MRKPNLDKWCDKFLEAVQKNCPQMEMRLDVSQMTSICMSVLRSYIEKKYGVAHEAEV